MSASSAGQGRCIVLPLQHQINATAQCPQGFAVAAPAHRVAGCVVVSETMNSGLLRQAIQQFRQFHREGREIPVAEPTHM